MKTSRRNFLTGAGKGLLALVGAGIGGIAGCIDSNIPIRKEIDLRISLAENEGNQEDKARIKELYNHVDDAFERYQPINYKPKVTYFNLHSPEIIEDFGGIEKIHKVLPWTKQGLKDIDKAALAEAHQEYVAFKKQSPERRMHTRLIYLLPNAPPFPYTLFTK